MRVGVRWKEEIVVAVKIKHVAINDVLCVTLLHTSCFILPPLQNTDYKIKEFGWFPSLCRRHLGLGW